MLSLKSWTNLLFYLKAVKTGTSTHKASVGAGAQTFWKSKPEREPKQIVSAPQHCDSEPVAGCGSVPVIDTNTSPVADFGTIPGAVCFYSSSNRQCSLSLLATVLNGARCFYIAHSAAAAYQISMDFSVKL